MTPKRTYSKECVELVGQTSGQKLFGLLTLVAVALLLTPSVTTMAAPRWLKCSLSQVETMAGPTFDFQAENRSIAVVIDDEAQAMTLYEDGVSRKLDHVTITQIAMNGYTDDTSVGIQTSSYGIVLQSYAPNSTRSEFGICSPSARALP